MKATCKSDNYSKCITKTAMSNIRTSVRANWLTILLTFKNKAYLMSVTKC